MTPDRQIVVTHEDGSQILVWLWSNGEVEVNERAHAGDTWRPVGVLGGDTEVITLDTVNGSRG